MNKLFLLSLIAFIPFLCFAQTSKQLANNKFNPKDSTQPIAVVELFSSEGCSGCPPADAMLNTIAIDAANKHLPIYVLEEDVDYLDNSEWKDTFGDKQFSRRQQNYDRFLNNSNKYAPQILVNGINEIYAANNIMASQVINKVLKEPALVSISVSINPLNDTTDEVDYHLSSTDKNWIINFALVQKNAVSHITGGENKGLTLTHINVVRQLISDPITIPDGIAQFNNIPKYATSTYSIIAFVQDKLTMKIVGAVQIDI
jgi:hypothetical protein